MKEEVLNYIHQAQNIWKKLIEKKNDPLAAESLFNVGFCLLSRGNYKKAKKSLEDAKDIYKRIGDEHIASLLY